jgi:methionyl-tRNA formyltransferase
MKVVFAGTPKFSAFHLKLLLNSKHNICQVLTQPDRGSGRGKKIKSSEVKDLAVKNNIPLLQPSSFRVNKEAISILEEESPDIILVVAYGLMLPKEVLRIPRLGCINVHASLLPRWRGAAPIERCILGGDKKSGITFMKMEEGLDTGAVLRKVSCIIDDRETSESLEAKLKEISKVELLKFLQDLSLGLVEEEDQDNDLATYADKIKTEEGEINWTEHGAKNIDRKIRALSPKYANYTFLGKTRMKLLQVEINETPDSIKPGDLKITKKNELYVGCKDSCLRVLSIQPAGKKPMSGSEFVSGYRMELLKLKKFTGSLLEN